MFVLVLLTLLLLSGALFLQASGSIDLSTLPPLATAAAIAAEFALLYLSIVHSRTGDRPTSKLPALAALLVLAIAASALWTEYAPTSVTSLISTTRQLADTSSALRRTASVRIRKSEDGKFLVRSTINGQAVAMVVDTGAAAIVLKQSDAAAAGITSAGLNFDTAFKTANGTSYVAPVRLKSVRIGPLQVDDVEALVAKPGTINESLLGMSFLKRLESYEIAGDFVTLRQ